MATADEKDRLPAECVRPASWRDVTGCLLGVLLVVAVTNSVTGPVLRRRLADLNIRMMAKKWNMLLNPQQPVDWLILGDSSCKQGVVPEVLNTRLGARSFNACTVGAMLTVGDAWMLEAYLKKFGPVRAALVVHVYDVWAREKSELLLAMMEIPLPWGFWNHLSPAIAMSPSEQTQLFLSRYVPLYSENRSLSRIIQWPWTVRKSQAEIQADGYARWERPDPAQVEVDLQGHLEKLRRRKPFQMSEINRVGLVQLRELAETYGVDIYLANGPIYEGLYQHPEFQAYFKQVEAALEEFAATSPRIRYLAGAPQLFSKEEMVNTDHLIHTASQAYTRSLIEEILIAEREKALAVLSRDLQTRPLAHEILQEAENRLTSSWQETVRQAQGVADRK